MNVHNNKLILEILDSLFSSSVIAPLVVSYFRATWQLTDTYLFHNDKYLSTFASIMFGIVGHLVFTIGQNSFQNYFDPNQQCLTFYIGSRLYTIIFGIVCVNCWRGGWNLIEFCTPRDSTLIIVITLTAAFLLGLFKSLRNIVATPFVIVIDDTKDYFKIPTRFRKLVR
jgi:flagellar biosynthesis protein FliQ